MEVEVEQVEDVEDYNSDFYSLCAKLIRKTVHKDVVR